MLNFSPASNLTGGVAAAKRSTATHPSITRKLERGVIGAEIGPYRIQAKLGEGGMGTVFHALDTKLKRPVAIKMLSDELADAAARRRFQREAQTASSLNHPHIVTVYDTSEWEGRQYLSRSTS